MRLQLIFVLALIICTGSSNARAKRTVSAKFVSFLCRRCWQKLYRYCQVGVRLSKRSVAEDTESITALDHRIKRSSNTKEIAILSRRRRGTYSRRKQRRGRQIRVHINNCRVCQDLCFD